MLLLLTITTFLAAFLLFLVQPMVAKMALPSLGGSPAVWNTAMVVFQSLLLAGYAWAHWLARWGFRGGRPWSAAAIVTQCGLVLLAALALPVALPPWDAPGERSPVWWLVGALLIAVAAPFVALASISPTAQRWLARTDHPAARDPYFLYAASNAGSLLALLSYPLLIEPRLPLRAQSWLFSAAYLAVAAGMVACALLTWRAGGRRAELPLPVEAPNSHGDIGDAAGARWRLRGIWLFLSFTPSALMLGATLHISTDLAAVPLLWVAPLAIYLLTFIIAFSRRPAPPRFVSRAAAILGLAVVLTFLVRATEPVAAIVALHMGFLFFGALACHQRLAAARPAPERLTEFYLVIAVGGALGGVFASLVAPAIFDSVAEYPIAIALALLARTPLRRAAATPEGAPAQTPMPGNARRRSVALDIALAATLLAMAAAGARLDGPNWLPLVVGAGAPALLLYLASPRPRRFALGAAALLASATLLPEPDARTLLVRRTFFGVHRVLLEPDPDRPRASRVRLRHGATPHGMQRVDAEGGRDPTPLLYYHPRGPLGQLFAALGADARAQRVGLIGLGVGATAAYAPPGARWTFYEIDPEVVRIARDSGHFTHVAPGGDAGAMAAGSAEAAQAPVSPPALDLIVADGRLGIAAAPEGDFGMIILDAFSSDAIPTHLLTREALEMYRSRLAPGGLIVLHISNRRLDLAPVIAAAARDLGMAGRIQDDVLDDPAAGKWPSTWVVLADTPDALAPLRNNALWNALEANGARAWTDDYAAILRVMRWW